jgi:hypothetical protein
LQNFIHWSSNITALLFVNITPAKGEGLLSCTEILLQHSTTGSECQKKINNWQHVAGSRFSEETLEGSRKKTNQENSTLGLEADEAGIKSRKGD